MRARSCDRSEISERIPITRLTNRNTISATQFFGVMQLQNAAGIRKQIRREHAAHDRRRKCRGKSADPTSKRNGQIVHRKRQMLAQNGMEQHSGWP